MRTRRYLHVIINYTNAKFKGQVGLYRDDGLAVCRATPKQIEKTKQEVKEIFKSNGPRSPSKHTRKP